MFVDKYNRQEKGKKINEIIVQVEKMRNLKVLVKNDLRMKCLCD